MRAKYGKKESQSGQVRNSQHDLHLNFYMLEYKPHHNQMDLKLTISMQ